MDLTDKKGDNTQTGSTGETPSTIEALARQVQELQSKLIEKEQALQAAVNETGSLKQKLELREQQADVFINKMINGFTVSRLILNDKNEPIDFEITEVNDAFLKSTKLEREEVVGVPITSIFPEIKSFDPNLIQMAADVSLRGENFVGEIYIESLDKWFEISAYSVRHGYFNALFKDITPRKLAEKELEASKTYLEYSIDSAPDGVMLMGPDMRFTHVNPAFRKMFDTSEEVLIGKTLMELAPELISAKRASWIQEGAVELMKSGNPISGVEFELTTSSGKKIPASFSAAGIQDKTGKVMGIVIFVKNITERKRTQELMIQTEKMMSVGGLAAGMAHEINNPLGGMLQGAQNIIRRLSPDLVANVKDAQECGLNLQQLSDYIKRRKIDEMLEGIISSGKRAAQIITNMLQFSRQSESQLCPNDINMLIDEALELCASDYDLTKKHDFRKIEIVKEYDTSLPLVPCTKTEIEQVILNLLKNAAHAMGMTSEKRAPKITIRTASDEKYARIEIEDNGPGLGASEKNRVFEPFYTTKPVGMGTGLGLSVSYMIVTNNHKGSLEVTSAPDKGAHFMIKLPLVNKAVAQPETHPGQES